MVKKLIFICGPNGVGKHIFEQDTFAKRYQLEKPKKVEL
jgi:hypothetical protein